MRLIKPFAMKPETDLFSEAKGTSDGYIIIILIIFKYVQL